MVDVVELNISEVFVASARDKTYQLKNTQTDAVIDISGYTERYFNLQERGGSKVITDKTLDFVTDGTDGKVTLNLSAAETGALTAGTAYDFQITMKNAAGDKKTYAHGTIIPRAAI